LGVPAVTIANVGSGQAAAFTYDLAQSVVYQRQGNPAWAGEPRSALDAGSVVIRADDLFYGDAGAVGSFGPDPQPDWVNLNKVAIPQADEQQRLLANLIQSMLLANQKVVPRAWYLPFNLRGAVVMTGDDHANNGTTGRFNAFLQMSDAGCSVADWQCIRATSYAYPGTVSNSGPNGPLTNAAAAAYVDAGFEIAEHVTTNCVDYLWTGDLNSDFWSDLNLFVADYPSLPPSATNRTHCVVWSDWSSEPWVELSSGIRLDATYYYYPSYWFVTTYPDGGVANDHPGYMTGSGFPQRFADSSGQLIDVYQAMTQLTDESGQSYPESIDALLANIPDPPTGLGYYGVITANMHGDQLSPTDNSQVWAVDIANAATAYGLPVVSAVQMLTWLDARNNTNFGRIRWSHGIPSTVSWTMETSAHGLTLLLPTTGGGSQTLQGVSANGTPLTVTTQTIKGVSYGTVIGAGPGNYVATYQ
jgi:hypothetical protein